MRTYTAEYLHPLLGLMHIEFDHDFSGDSVHFTGTNLENNEVFQFLYAGNLVPTSIQAK